MTHSRSINARSRPQQRSWRWLECLMTMSVLLLISVVSASSPGEDALPTFSAPDAVRHQPSVLSPLSNATATDEVLLRPVLRSPSSTDSERSDLLPADDMADVVNIVFKGEKGVVDTIKDWLDTKTSLSIVMGVCGGIIAVSLLAIICCCCHSDPGPSIKQIEEAKQKLANAPVVVEPTIGNGKLTVIVCDVENAAELWNLRPDKYEWVDAAYKSELRNCCSSNNCFELKSVGSLFIFTANRPVDGVKFAAAVQDYFPSVKAAGRLVPRVRIAVHRGDCKVTRDVRTGKYECTGAAVEGALWTMIDTTPGHAWATEPVYEVLTPEELETVDLRVVGERAVRGLRKNFNMYEVFTAGGSVGFPAPSIDSPVMGSLANTKAMKESPAGGPNDNPLARPSSSKSAISPNSDSARSPRSPRTSSSRRRRGEQANAIHYPERPTSGRGRTVVQIDDRPRSPSAFPPTETGSPPALQRSKDGKLVIPLSPSQLFGRRRRGSLPTEEPSPVGSPVPTSILRNKVNTAPPTPTPVVPDDGKLIVKSQPFPPDLTDETIPDHPSQMNQARMKHFHFALYPETYMRSATEMPNAK